MFIDFVRFEIKYRLRQVSTYVYFLLWFLMMFFAVSTADFGPVGNGKVMLNGPFALGLSFVQLTTFGVFVISAIFGTSILRDFRDNTYQLIFTKPVKKFDYLFGRWAGSFVVCVMVFSGLIFGAMAGVLMPWTDKTRVAPINLWFHLQPFLSLTLIQIFYLGSLFFTVAALTRRVVIVYLQAVVLFAIYLIGIVILSATGGVERYWPSVFDPLGAIMFQTITRYWTVVERNNLLLPWSGSFLYNRILWTSVGVVALGIAWRFFPMSAELLAGRVRTKKASSAPKQEEEDQSLRVPERIELAPVTRHFGPSAQWTQFVSLTRTRFLNIVRDVPFWAILLIMIVLAVLNASMAGRQRETAVWPVTYLMTAVLQGASSLFLYIIATMYGGELIWRERDVRFDQIHDSLPLKSWLDWCSQFGALMLVELSLITIVMFCGMGAQTWNGYYHYEVPVYLEELYLVAFPSVMAFALMVFFWQTVISKKFVAHGAVIGVVLIIPVLEKIGVENRLLLIGEQSPYTFSDMNGYGHFVPALAWSTLYWLAFSTILAIVSIALVRRGTDLAWTQRFKAATASSRGLVVPMVIAVAVFIGSGAWFYYNGHILNTFRTVKEERKLRADYERAYKKYQRLPQPKITAVDVATNIYPERRSFDASGSFMLRNTTAQPIADIHITNPVDDVEQEIKFDRSFELKLDDKRLHYRIYHLAQPLEPGGTLKLEFRIAYQAKGFRDGGELAQMAYNGTFFDRDFFPGIGYNDGGELSNPVRRREENLPVQEEMPLPGDARARNINLFTADSNWITFHSVVSTSEDQIALAPGYLKREWTANGRRYFEYDMGDTKIANFFSFLSGRYSVKRDQYKGINLEIYYHPGHEYNLERMLQSTRKGLDYFDANFSPFQFKQFRVLEYPRYRTFAQSFPNTVPYSEGIGFIQRVRKPEDIDMIFYVTAHELAHQWWGHQLIGSATQGSNMMSETLAQYSALMIMEKEYGPDNIHKFLKHELDGYLRGRGGELRKEPPLTLVQREPYVWYNKGSLVMYALRDYMGEEKLNGALRKFLLDKRYATGPYPDTRDFVSYLRAAAPPELQNVITDMFERIVLFDNKAVTATWTKTADNQYKVALTLNARKLKADGQGNETELPVDDWIDVGIFSGDKDHPKPLYLAKHHFTGKETKLEFTVKGQPTRAGIDPYHKLIDRKPDDNVVDTSKS